MILDDRPAIDRIGVPPTPLESLEAALDTAHTQECDAEGAVQRWLLDKLQEMEQKYLRAAEDDRADVLIELSHRLASDWSSHTIESLDFMADELIARLA